MRHDLKIGPCYLEAIKEGRKNFEIRYNGDRGFNAGDEVQFKTHIINNEWETHVEIYEITYVYSGELCLKDHVVFGIKLKKGEEK